MKRFAMLTALAAAGLTLAAHPVAAEEKAKTIKGTLTIFEGQKFDRDYHRIDKDDPELPHEFLIGSIAVYPGDVWEVCDKPKYKGNCLTLSADETGIGKAVLKSARIVKAAP